MKATTVLGVGMAMLAGAAAYLLAGVDLRPERTRTALPGENEVATIEAPAAPVATRKGQGGPTKALRMPAVEAADPVADMAHATDITLIRKAIEAQDTTTSQHLIKRALENALMDRRTDIPTAFSAAEMLSASADNVGYLEWVVHALSSNLVHRQDETNPESAAEAAYGTVIEKLLSQQQFELAMQLSDQSLRALPQSEELLAARARILSANGDHTAAVAVLQTIERPSDNALSQLAQYLHRASDLAAATVLADRVRTSAPELASAIDHIRGAKP